MTHFDMDSAVLGTRFIDGGHLVNGEDAERIRLDPPIVTPEGSQAWALGVLATIGAAGVAILGMVCWWCWP